MNIENLMKLISLIVSVLEIINEYGLTFFHIVRILIDINGGL